MRATNVPSIVSFVARVACLFVAASASGSSAGVARATRDDGNIASLSSWLARFKFDVPAQSFRVPYAGIDVDLSANDVRRRDGGKDVERHDGDGEQEWERDGR